MIRYALVCEHDHRFEAWFSSSNDYDRQAEAGLVECPHCGTTEVRKQIMAPAIATGRSKPARQSTLGGGGARPDFQALARQVQAHIRSNYEYVGDQFATQARAIHEGDAPERLIYGETTPAEREALKDAGVPCAPLPDAFTPVPPKKAN